jgi:shikimate kinase
MAMRLDRHIVLIGASGSGKTTLAPILAARLDILCCDTDALIEERTGVAGGLIIEQQGIDAFRSIEKIVVCDALKSSLATVIATGAGAWTIAAVRRQCTETGVSVWLRGDFDELVRRVTNSDRYITRVRAPQLVIAEQIAQRTQFYAAADIQIDCNDRTTKQIVEAILMRIRHQVCR